MPLALVKASCAWNKSTRMVANSDLWESLDLMEEFLSCLALSNSTWREAMWRFVPSSSFWRRSIVLNCSSTSSLREDTSVDDVEAILSRAVEAWCRRVSSSDCRDSTVCLCDLWVWSSSMSFCRISVECEGAG